MTTTCVASQTSRLMLDHPGWFTTPDGQAQRAFRWGTTTWTVTCHRAVATVDPTIEIVHGSRPEADVAALVSCFDPALLPSPFRDTPVIRDCGRVYRVRSTDLWESLLPPLVGQRNRAGQRIQRYRRLCTAIGGRITTPLGTVLTAPRAETVVTASGGAWDELVGLPWARTVRAAAEAYLDHQKAWQDLPPDALFHALRDIPGIGKPSAAAVIADFTNDFSRYEFADFGTPGRWEQFVHDLGANVTMFHFETAWRSFTPDQRSTLTALSLDARLRQPEATQARRFT